MGQVAEWRRRAHALFAVALPKEDPRTALLEKQQMDIYREAIQRSGRPWKAIAGKAISRPKRLKNDSSSSSVPLLPTSEECTRTHSPSMKAQASPGTHRTGRSSQIPNFGSTPPRWAMDGRFIPERYANYPESLTV